MTKELRASFKYQKREAIGTVTSLSPGSSISLDAFDLLCGHDDIKVLGSMIL